LPGARISAALRQTFINKVDVIALLLIIKIIAVDFTTGKEISFTPFYLISISIAALHDNLRSANIFHIQFGWHCLWVFPALKWLA
jgi:hypothetical protein